MTSKKLKKNNIKYPSVFFRVSAIHKEFINTKIHQNVDVTNQSRGKGDIFVELFIEKHPDFKSFKKSKVARELDGE